MKTPPNILLTSAGRRCSLLRAFEEAAEAVGCQVVVADASVDAPSMWLAEHSEVVPRVDHPEYVGTICEIAQRYDIGLIVPLIDPELPVLAAHSEAILQSNGICKVAGSTSELVAMSNDKWLTYRHMADQKIAVAASWLPLEALTNLAQLPDQLFVKPRNGSSSQHIHATTKDQLESVLSKVPDPIVQNQIIGREITVDALIDDQGVLIHFVPRVRDRTLAGESIVGTTIKNSGMNDWIGQALEACARLGARGPITIQLFDTDQGYVFNEINPRFGGGYPLAYQAGAHYPQWLIAQMMGKSLQPRIGDYTEGLRMSRYYTEVFSQAHAES